MSRYEPIQGESEFGGAVSGNIGNLNTDCLFCFFSIRLLVFYSVSDSLPVVVIHFLYQSRMAEVVITNIPGFGPAAIASLLPVWDAGVG